MKTVIAFAALIALSGTAMAGQPSAVQSMTDYLKANQGAASIASAVSGKAKTGVGNGGWGNIGSSAVTGAQVSNRK